MRIGFRERRRGTIDKILGPKRAEVARMLAAPRLAPRRAPGGDAVEALTRSRIPASQRGEGHGDAVLRGPLRLIAEVKRRSPSAGELSTRLTPDRRALAYARGGAAAISVLTDAPFFGGSYADLAACRDALDRELGAARPRLLCKEFVIHEVQLHRAVDAGADLVLLIARIVTPEALVALATAARSFGLEPLIEVATRAELDAAFAAGARVIGVNARDLDTLKMDAERAADVLAAIGDRAISVHLSGLATPGDVARIAAGQADAALIGEALMRQDDPDELLRAMMTATA